jgi:hypothetical protein
MAMKCVCDRQLGLGEMFRLRQSTAHRSETLCIISGSIKKDLSVVVNETVHAKERINRVAVRSQITKKYFIPSAIVTFASAFTGLMTTIWD